MIVPIFAIYTIKQTMQTKQHFFYCFVQKWFKNFIFDNQQKYHYFRNKISAKTQKHKKKTTKKQQKGQREVQNQNRAKTQNRK